MQSSDERTDTPPPTNGRDWADWDYDWPAEETAAAGAVSENDVPWRTRRSTWLGRGFLQDESPVAGVDEAWSWGISSRVISLII